MCVRSVGPVFFPLDKAWGLDASLYSPELKRQMVWLSGLLPYGQAEAVMQRIGKRTISDSSLWRTVERQGQRLTAEAETSECVATVKNGAFQVRGTQAALAQRASKELSSTAARIGITPWALGS